jgi:hypothetical protein
LALLGLGEVAGKLYRKIAVHISLQFFSQESCDVGDNYRKYGIGRGAEGIVTYVHVCCGLM